VDEIELLCCWHSNATASIFLPERNEMNAPSFMTAPATGIRNPFWLFPIGAAIGCVLFLLGEDGPLLQQAFIGAMWGAFGAVPLVIVSGFVLLGLHRHYARRAAGADQGR
jgi:hypothetical protein